MNEDFENIAKARCWDANESSKINAIAVLEQLEKRLTKRLTKGNTFSLTALQQTAIHSPQFWRNWGDEKPKNLVVQGATSAGKTLLAELNIVDTLFKEKKAIILVPLKAMVHQHTEQLKIDLQLGNVPYIFASSSDHMENDELLIRGEYSVAVIVYEKFFALLSQSNSQIMDQCGLLVVDELSMLSKEQRGPKLEMTLELVRRNNPQTRIMCLATCDCKTEKICNWLKADKPIISSARPVALEEHIVLLNGEDKFRIIPADHDFSEDIESHEEQIEIPGYQYEWRVTEKKRRLLTTIIQKIEDKAPEARLLIVTNSKEGTVRTAQYLKENLSDHFPQITEDSAYEEFLENVKACDFDEGQEELYKSLLPRGIAFHHAGLSTSLREVIEAEFQKQTSPIKVIVATETLTVGVNMPFDAMIIMSYQMPRTGGKLEKLNLQEYRNYIGRAGRLGQCHNLGQTYLMAEDKQDSDNYWSSYGKQPEISSALDDAKAAELAPYYLSLLSNGGNRFVSEDIINLFDNSLSKTCHPNLTIQAEEMCDQMYDAYLIDQINGGNNQGRNASNVVRYSVDSFGALIAPYALSIDTCIRIYAVFHQGLHKPCHFLDFSKEEIDTDVYLLDVLFHICRHNEVENSPALILPTNPLNYSGNVVRQLRHILSSKFGKNQYQLWGYKEEKQYNELWYLLAEEILPVPNETRILQAAVRAVVLFYWTQGKTISEIKQITKFNTFLSITSGDVERLAEVVSFHMEAIYRTFNTRNIQNEKANETIRAFYALQTRVKYGMPRDMVQLANKHIYGLDRARLLRLKKKADSCGMKPMRYLYVTPASQMNGLLTSAQHSELIQALEQRGNVRKFDILMDIVRTDAGTSVSDQAISALEEIHSWNGEDPRDLYESLESFWKSSESNAIEISCHGCASKSVLKLKNKTITLGVLDDKKKESNSIQRHFQEYGSTRKLLIVSNKAAEQINSKEYDCDALLGTTFLAMILAKTLHMEMSDGKELFDFLYDIYGTYTEYSDIQYFVPNNYVEKRLDPRHTPSYRLICCQNSANQTLLDMLATSDIPEVRNYEFLSYGDTLYTETDRYKECPTVILLDREQVIHSQSLNKFLYIMSQQNSKNCLVLFRSQIEADHWNRNTAVKTPYCAQFYPRLSSLEQRIAPNLSNIPNVIQQYLSSWKKEPFLIGISYAHFDDHEENSSDIKKLKVLVDLLVEEYGEHRILFDKLPSASNLFPIKGKERSLSAYKECKLCLLLWNFWSTNADNCIQEREAMKPYIENGTMKVMYLHCGTSNDRPVPDKDYPQSLNNPHDILADIRRILG